MHGDLSTPARSMLRPWRDDGDWALMADIANATREVDGRDTFATADALRSEIAGWPGADARRSIRLAEVDGLPIAWTEGTAYKGDAVTLLLGVRVRLVPSWRDGGEAAALLAAAESCALADADAQYPGDTSARSFQSWLIDTDRHLIGLVTRHGYAPVRWGHEMRRDLGEVIPPVDLPAGIAFRPVDADDARRVLLASDEAFQDAWEYPLMSEEEILSTLDHPKMGQVGHWVVAWEGDEPVAGSLGFVDEEENEAFGRRRGYVERIWTRRPWRGRGLATAVIARSLAMYRDEGMAEAHLSVDTQNPSGALGLYERMGFVRTGGLAVYRKPAP
jgi:mycothiol synthase